MRPSRTAFYIAFLLFLLAAACSPQGTNHAATPTVHPTATLVAVVPNTGLFSNQQPVVVNKPQLQLGAAYRYFDGSLLDAVPNTGPFLMGSVNSNGDNPQHKVTVSGFWIYSTEVTNQMYAWCVSLGKCTPPYGGDDPTFKTAGVENYPVVGVTWQQASDYCGFAHGRLPTEAEWEKAATWDAASNLQLLYPWGNDPARCDLLNFKYCVGHATSVMQYGQGRSFYGTYNMEGNVSEWVSDWYDPTYYSNSPAQDPTGPATGTAKVIRGSAWDSDAMYASPSWRFSAPPTSHRNDLGFRCVVPDPSYYAPFCTAPVSYGVTAAGTSTQNCPAPSVQDLQGCGSANNGIDLVTVFANPVATVTVSGLQGCTPSDNQLGVKHVCPAGVTITVNSSCGAPANSSPSCPPNYQLDPKNPLQCTSPGSPGACPAGFSYDNSLKCCTIPAGSNIPAAPCAVGQHSENGACVLDSVGVQQPGTLTFTTGQVACVVGPGGIFVTATAASPIPTNPPTLTPFPSSTPFPTLPFPTLPFPTNTFVPPFPSNTPGPTNTPAPTSTPFPSNTPKPTHTPKFGPTATSAVIFPTDTPVSILPSDTPAPAPTATSAPAPTATPGAGAPQLVTVPLYLPMVLSSSALQPIYPSSGPFKR